MAKKIALYENPEWQKNTPESPGVDFTIPSNTKNPQLHPSFSVTNQSDAESTDINKIMARYEKTGLITDLITGEARKPIYGDFTGIGNYYDLRTRLARANELFDALPAAVRNRFDNDPQKLIDFVQDAKTNANEMHDLGLISEEELLAINPPPPPSDSDLKKSQEPPAAAPGQPANPAA